MSNSTITSKKIIKIIAKVWLYSLGILVICLGLGYSFDIKTIVKSILPVTYSGYSFVTAYVMLMLISPFINKFISKISKEEYLRLLVLLLVCWCIIPTFINGDLSFSYFGWFVTLYLIGGYIRNFVEINSMKKKNITIVMVATVFILLASIIIFNYLGIRYGIEKFASNARYFSDMNMLPVVVIAICMLLLSLNNNWHSKIINKISSTTFGIYLIHDNPILRSIIWNDIFHVERMNLLSPLQLILQGFTIIAIVYIVCLTIDILMQSTIEKYFVMLLQRIYASSKAQRLKSIFKQLIYK